MVLSWYVHHKHNISNMHAIKQGFLGMHLGNTMTSKWCKIKLFYTVYLAGYMMVKSPLLT